MPIDEYMQRKIDACKEAKKRYEVAELEEDLALSAMVGTRMSLCNWIEITNGLKKDKEIDGIGVYLGYDRLGHAINIRRRGKRGALKKEEYLEPEEFLRELIKLEE